MHTHFYTDRLVSIHLSYQAVNTENSLIAQQIGLLTEAFERKIKYYTKKQLSFLKDCLMLKYELEAESTGFLPYQLFLIEERLKKYTM